ncbi:unnamed protein product [Blepharisma stoltei]|uniref:EF-hand domain-containing protein n=1 Tax=Blepharisma stoltei TaxID=1481888 RepID=A0AAU9K2I7_9CILI|nr:unnamed protein product [Blepharisma stoltei]
METEEGENSKSSGVYDTYMSHELTDENQLDLAAKELMRTKLLRIKAYKDSKAKVLSSQERTWLRKRGKRQYIDFEDSIRNELRKYFLSMDQDGRGSIGIDELMEPLIALGLAENRQQVKELFDAVDTDKSGQIEFDEFLAILKGGDGSSPMADFFKQMTKGTLTEDAKNLPFKLVVSSYRRKMLMEAVMTDDPNKKAKGEKIMKAYGSQLDLKSSSRKAGSKSARVLPKN